MVDPVVYTKAQLKSLDPEKFCRCSEKYQAGCRKFALYQQDWGRRVLYEGAPCMVAVWSVAWSV